MQSMIGAQERNKSLGRVLLIAPQPFFVQRGTPLNVRATAVALAKAGLAVDILAFPFGDEVEIPGVTVHRSLRVPGIRHVPIGPTWRKVALDFLLLFSALKLVMSRRYSVLQGIEEGGFVALSLGKIFGIPSVFDMDSCMVSQLETSGFMRSRILLRFVSLLETACIRNSSAIVTVCEALTVKAQSIAPQARIHQIEDFPMDDVEQVDESSLAAARSFLRAGRPTILYTGNFEGYQGLELLLEGFKLSLSNSAFKGESPILLLVGGDDASIARLRALVSERGLENDVVFSGPRPGKEMGAFMHCADVLASPRLIGNNTPLKLYSYMASGKPIVATKIESHTQVLSDATAYLAEPTPESISSAISAAFDPSPAAMEIRTRRAAQALALVQSRYSRERFERQFHALYEELLDVRQAEAARA